MTMHQLSHEYIRPSFRSSVRTWQPEVAMACCDNAQASARCLFSKIWTPYFCK